jgi:hypothetical protein
MELIKNKQIEVNNLTTDLQNLKLKTVFSFIENLSRFYENKADEINEKLLNNSFDENDNVISDSSKKSLNKEEYSALDLLQETYMAKHEALKHILNFFNY